MLQITPRITSFEYHLQFALTNIVQTGFLAGEGETADTLWRDATVIHDIYKNTDMTEFAIYAVLGLYLICFNE